MDTDDLSDAAYKGILVTAERFNHNLTLQFGLIASSCENEMEYLKGALERIQEIRTLDEEYYSFIFFDEIPKKEALFQVLDKITENISRLNKKCKSNKKKKEQCPLWRITNSPATLPPFPASKSNIPTCHC